MAWYTAVNAHDTSDATASDNDIRKGKTAYVNNKLVTGTMPEKAAATYTPSTKDQTITSGVYLAGDQTIKGDSNLISDNIVRKKSIFGVEGNQIPIEFNDQVKMLSSITHETITYDNEKILTSFNKNTNAAVIMSAIRLNDENYNVTKVYSYKILFTYLSLDTYDVVSSSTFIICRSKIDGYADSDTDEIIQSRNNFTTTNFFPVTERPMITSISLENDGIVLVSMRGISSYIGSGANFQNIAKIDLKNGKLISTMSILDDYVNHISNAVNCVKMIDDNIYIDGPATQPGLNYITVDGAYSISPYSSAINGYILYEYHNDISTEPIQYYVVTEQYNSSLGIYEPKLSEKKQIPAYGWCMDRYSRIMLTDYHNANVWDYICYFNGYYYIIFGLAYDDHLLRTTDFSNFDYISFTDDFKISFYSNRTAMVSALISDTVNNKLLFLCTDDHRFAIYDGTTNKTSYLALPYDNYNTGYNGFTTLRSVAFDYNKTFVFHFGQNSANSKDYPDPTNNYIFVTTNYGSSYTVIDIKDIFSEAIQNQLSGYSINYGIGLGYINEAFYIFSTARNSNSSSYNSYVIISKSIDGLNWETPTLVYNSDTYYTTHSKKSIAGDSNNTIVIITTSERNNDDSTRVGYIYSRDNGVSWSSINTLRSSFTANGTIATSIAYGNGKFIVTISCSDDDYVRIYYSTNGSSWSSTSLSINSDKECCYRVSYCNDRFIMMPSWGYRFFYSTDGISWTSSAALYNRGSCKITIKPYMLTDSRYSLYFNNSSYSSQYLEKILYIVPDYCSSLGWSSYGINKTIGTLDGSSWYLYKRNDSFSISAPDWLSDTYYPNKSYECDDEKSFTNNIYIGMSYGTDPTSSIYGKYPFYTTNGRQIYAWTAMISVLAQLKSITTNMVDYFCVFYSTYYNKYLIILTIYDKPNSKRVTYMYYTTSIGTATVNSYNFDSADFHDNFVSAIDMSTLSMYEELDIGKIVFYSKTGLAIFKFNANGTAIDSVSITKLSFTDNTIYKYNNKYYTYISSNDNIKIYESSNLSDWTTKTISECNIFKIINQGVASSNIGKSAENYSYMTLGNIRLSLGLIPFSDKGYGGDEINSSYSKSISSPGIYLYDSSSNMEYLMCIDANLIRIVRSQKMNNIGGALASNNLVLLHSQKNSKKVLYYIHPKSKSGYRTSLYKLNDDSDSYTIIDDSPNDYIDGDVIDILQISETRYITVNKRRLLSTALGVEYARPMEYLINYYTINEGKADTKQNTIAISVNPTNYTFTYLHSIYSNSYIYTTFLRSDNRMIRYTQTNDIESSLTDIPVSSISGVSTFGGALVTSDYIYIIHTNNILQKLYRGTTSIGSSIWKFTIPQTNTNESFIKIDIDSRGNIWCISQYRTVILVESVGSAYLKSNKTNDPAYIAINNRSEEYNDLYDVFYIYD